MEADAMSSHFAKILAFVALVALTTLPVGLTPAAAQSQCSARCTQLCASKPKNAATCINQCEAGCKAQPKGGKAK
jgi:hypothetical protein